MNTENTKQSKLIYIETALLYPHPDNPRKELGDLTELAESIKAKGILQNLTVVPGHRITGKEYMDLCASDPKEARRVLDDDYIQSGYTVIIGNRRRAAAELAGIEKLPCVIVEMSQQEQVATMLLENIQRSDLTIYEQAQGMQMMMDLGESVESISEKTGFSQSTIRRRVKLMELDQSILKDVSASRQLSFGDFEKLNKISDLKARNTVLKDIGTNNFENALRRAESDQKMNEKIEKFKAIAKERGFIALTGNDKKNPYEKYRQELYIWILDEFSLKKLDDLASEVRYYYKIDYGSLYIYSERAATPSETVVKEEKANAERESRLNKLNDAAERAYKLRAAFISDYSRTDVKKNLDLILYMAAHVALEGYEDEFIEWYDIEYDEDDDDAWLEAIEKIIVSDPAAALLTIWFLYSDQKPRLYDYNGRYQKSSQLDEIYEKLMRLGYEPSDEENELRNGTSELFLNGECQ